MREWREALSRYRFSWVEVLGWVCVARMLDTGAGFIAALGVLVAFAFAQALLPSWPA